MVAMFKKYYSIICLFFAASASAHAALGNLVATPTTSLPGTASLSVLAGEAVQITGVAGPGVIKISNSTLSRVDPVAATTTVGYVGGNQIFLGPCTVSLSAPAATVPVSLRVTYWLMSASSFADNIDINDPRRMMAGVTPNSPRAVAMANQKSLRLQYAWNEKVRSGLELAISQG